MDNGTVHLSVIQADGSSNVEQFDSYKHDFRWNEDYTAFRPIRLRWHDDRSYAAYQAGDDDEGRR